MNRPEFVKQIRKLSETFKSLGDCNNASETVKQNGNFNMSAKTKELNTA